MVFFNKKPVFFPTLFTVGLSYYAYTKAGECVCLSTIGCPASHLITRSDRIDWQSELFWLVSWYDNK